MLLKAKNPGSCAVCLTAIAVGDAISLTVEERAHAACSKEGKALAKTLGLSSATHSNLILPAPCGLSYLPYQKAGIEFALKRKATLLADEMGLGKTIQAIGLINADQSLRHILIVTRASLKLNWKLELKKWLVRPLKVALYPKHGDITLISYGHTHQLSEQQEFDLVVLDEAHTCRNPKTNFTKACAFLCAGSRKRLFLTGTPIVNRPLELWPLLQMLDPKEWDRAGVVKGNKVAAGCGAGFLKYAFAYCGPVRIIRGKRVRWDFTGTSQLTDLSERLRKTVMIRRLKKDVLVDLPAKRRQIVIFPNREDDCIIIRNEYEKAVEDLKLLYKVHFQEIARLRHTQALAKLPFAIEFLQGIVAEGNKVVVFAHHRDVIDTLFEAFPQCQPVKLTGDMSEAERQCSVEIFQSDPRCQMFIGSLQAAGVGITLTAASHAVFVEISFVPSELTQAEDRVHRIGQSDAVLAQYLVLDNTLDCRMMQLIVEKQRIADLALGDIGRTEGASP